MSNGQHDHDAQFSSTAAVSRGFPSARKPPRIAVVGGGISGMAAAWYLARCIPDAEILLFEAASRLGGVLETIRDGDYLVERSADNFATLIPDALRFCEETGYAGELLSPNPHGRQAFVLNRGRVLPIPIGFSLMQPTRIGPIATTQTLSMRGKLRMMCEYFVKARLDESDESLQSFATRRLGREAFENLVEPIVSGIFTADPAKLSMQATLPQFVAMERKHGGLIRGHWALRREDSAAAARRASGARYDQFLAPRLGMSHWIDHIQQQLPAASIRLNTKVLCCKHITGQPVEKSGMSSRPSIDYWKVETARETFDCDAVIVTTPNYLTNEFLQVEPPEISRLLASVPYASSAVVAVVVDRCDVRNRLNGFGLIVPRKENRSTLAISYSSNKYANRAPEDQVLLRLFFGGAMQEEMVERTDAELQQIAKDELRTILGWRAAQPRWQTVIRWKRAMPQYHVGHVQRMEQLQLLLASMPTLKLCGAGFSGVGIPQCIRSARVAVEEIQQRLAQHQP